MKKPFFWSANSLKVVGGLGAGVEIGVGVGVGIGVGVVTRGAVVVVVDVSSGAEVGEEPGVGVVGVDGPHAPRRNRITTSEVDVITNILRIIQPPVCVLW